MNMSEHSFETMLGIRCTFRIDFRYFSLSFHARWPTAEPSHVSQLFMKIKII